MVYDALALCVAMSAAAMMQAMWNGTYRKTSNIRHALEGNKIVDHSDVVGALPVGVAPTTSSFLT